VTPDRIAHYGDELFEAQRKRRTVEPLTRREADMTVDDAYGISRHILARRLSEGERVVGKKIGVTSEAVQKMLGVFQPDFGFLTDAMSIPDGGAMPASREMIQPRAEGEIAFILARNLRGPGVTEDDVVRATERVIPCFEVVDSRIRDWKIAYCDTVADNASSGLFVLGTGSAHPRDLDLAACEMVVSKNGTEISRGKGSAALGSPLTCVAWLANALGHYDIPLEAGEVILSGSLVPLEPVRLGDEMSLELRGVGTCRVRFT
jgi:2-oxopent-4-enoate/cis-2-oxohex-4-enoate hydratase